MNKILGCHKIYTVENDPDVAHWHTPKRRKQNAGNVHDLRTLTRHEFLVSWLLDMMNARGTVQLLL